MAKKGKNKGKGHNAYRVLHRRLMLDEVTDDDLHAQVYRHVLASGLCNYVVSVHASEFVERPDGSISLMAAFGVYPTFDVACNNIPDLLGKLRVDIERAFKSDTLPGEVLDRVRTPEGGEFMVRSWSDEE
jgi:hypothetical protein